MNWIIAIIVGESALYFRISLLIIVGLTTAARSSVDGFLEGSRLDEECEIVDMTHPFDSRTLNWIGAKKYQLTVVKNGTTPSGYYYSSNNYEGAEHAGTHMDAPIHFSGAGQLLDQIPLRKLVGEACVVDVVEKCKKDRNYQIGRKDVEMLEKSSGRSVNNCILLFYTGWDSYWPNKRAYMGTDSNDTSKLTFPGISPYLAQWLVEHRQIKAVGIDTASMDYGKSKDFRTHIILAANQTPGLENVKNIGKLPTSRARTLCLWKGEERLLFEMGLQRHGKDFCKVAKLVKIKSRAECVSFYYFTKSTYDYRTLVKKQKAAFHERKTTFLPEVITIDDSSDGDDSENSSQNQSEDGICFTDEEPQDSKEELMDTDVDGGVCGQSSSMENDNQDSGINQNSQEIKDQVIAWEQDISVGISQNQPLLSPLKETVDTNDSTVDLTFEDSNGQSTANGNGICPEENGLERSASYIRSDA